MPLLEIWRSRPDTVATMNLTQVVAMAGGGNLADNNECSKEFRLYLSEAPVEQLAQYIEFCLHEKMDKGGFILQDLVNELGRRLDYKVENGLYQGRQNMVGFDGIWDTAPGHSIVVEVKTTDAYRINLDTIANYRKGLIDQGRITDSSSILVVVGRQDTGDMEAQIRGSRHAWDMRIISIDALLNLVRLKEKSDEDETVAKIRSLLIPVEYTRLDNIIEILFTTAKDVETASEELLASEPMEDVRGERNHQQSHTPIQIADATRATALKVYAHSTGATLLAHRRTQFWSLDRKIRVVCAFSKNHREGHFWYAFHPHQLTFLEEAETAVFLLSCLNHRYSYAIPLDFLKLQLGKMGMTEKEDRRYWHIILEPTPKGEMRLRLREGEFTSLDQFKLAVPDA